MLTTPKAVRCHETIYVMLFEHSDENYSFSQLPGMGYRLYAADNSNRTFLHTVPANNIGLSQKKRALTFPRTDSSAV